jgi:hypothetical protein
MALFPASKLASWALALLFCHRTRHRSAILFAAGPQQTPSLLLPRYATTRVALLAVLSFFLLLLLQLDRIRFIKLGGDG